MDWNLSNVSSNVRLATGVEVHTSIYGPPRASLEQPLCLILPGVGGTSFDYPALIRSLSSIVRVLFFDRPGLGRSPASAAPRSIEGIVADIKAVLEATGVQPPYVTLAHSWGGMLSTAFAASLLDMPGAVRGMVMLDAGAPTAEARHQDFTTDPGTPWSHPCVLSSVTGLDVFTVTHPQPSTTLTMPEYNTVQAHRRSPDFQKAAMAEFGALQKSYLVFAEAQYFYRSPPLLSGVLIATVHGHAYDSYEHLYQLSMVNGTGSEADREGFRKLLPTWRENVLANQKQFLLLTEPENQHFIIGKEGTGHNVHMVDVDSCVRAVQWVLTKAGYV